jgi:hypothetical protein
MEGFSFAEYFAEINTLADLQFMPGEKPYIDYAGVRNRCVEPLVTPEGLGRAVKKRPKGDSSMRYLLALPLPASLPRAVIPAT